MRDARASRHPLMKTKLEIDDTVWIHIGTHALFAGQIVNIFNMSDVYSNRADTELYTIEIPSSIDYLYEVRTYDQISLTETGPINIFKSNPNIVSESRYLNKLGVQLPFGQQPVLRNGRKR